MLQKDMESDSYISYVYSIEKWLNKYGISCLKLGNESGISNLTNYSSMVNYLPKKKGKKKKKTIYSLN